jgi:hypothetical protein
VSEINVGKYERTKMKEYRWTKDESHCGSRYIWDEAS